MVRPVKQFFNIPRKDRTTGEIRNVNLLRIQYRNTRKRLGKMFEMINEQSEKLYRQGYRGLFNTTINDAPIHAFTSRMMKIGEKVDINEKDFAVKYFWESWGMVVDQEYAEAQLALVQWFNNPNSISTSYDIKVYPEESAGGCDGKYNNCLYDALADILGTRFTKQYPKKGRFKATLGLGKKDKIDISLISVIEEKIKVNINVEGDFIHQSTNKYDMSVPSPRGCVQAGFQLSVPLVLTSGHYSPNKSKLKQIKVKNISYKERQPVFYSYIRETQNFRCYDGSKYYMMPLEEMIEHKKNPLTSTKLLIKYTLREADTIDIKLKIAYDEFVFNADKLKKTTNGRINFYKTGKIKDTALNLFYSMTKHLSEPEPISQDEAEWLQDCKNCGLIFGNPYEGQAYYYDIKSEYPSELRGTGDYAFKRGQFETITDDKFYEKPRYGIYRCIISSSDPQAYKIFLFNPKNKYTQVEVIQAFRQNFTIELIKDDKPNFLHYPASCRLKGTKLFREYIDYCFKLKDENPELVYPKRLLNILGGGLTEKNKREIIIKVDEGSSTPEIFSDEIITNSHSMTDTEEKITVVSISNVFKSGYARLYPFLTARGRVKIAGYINTIGKEHVHRVHTDSILSDIEMPDIPTKQDADIGELGFEGFYEKVQVVNCMEIKIKENKKYT